MPWVGRSVCAAGALWTCCSLVAFGRGEQYIEAYNELVRMVTNRYATLGAVASGVSLKAPDADSVTQYDLEVLRAKARALMDTYIAPPPFRVDKEGAADAFPYLGKVRAERGGKFLCIPGDCTAGGQPIYRDTFGDEVPLLWEHFDDLWKALHDMRYTLRGGSPPRGLGCTWTAKGEANSRWGEGPYGGYSWGYAIDRAEQDYEARGAVTEDKEPLLCAIGWRYEMYDWTDKFSGRTAARFAYFRVTDIPAFPHRAQVYVRATVPPVLKCWPAAQEWDNSRQIGGLKQDEWVPAGGAGGESTAGEYVSERIGSIDGRQDPWCAEPPNPQDYRRSDSATTRGFWVRDGALVLEWTGLYDPVLRAPTQDDPDRDGLVETECECRSCKPGADAGWRNLMNDPEIEFPLGLSGAGGVGGARVKAYVTESQTCGSPRQMFSLDTCVWAQSDPGGQWSFATVKRPSGAEVAFPLQGTQAGRPRGVGNSYRLAASDGEYELRFGGEKRVVHRFAASGAIKEVRVTCGGAEVRVEGTPNTWPGLTVSRNAQGRITGVICPLLSATPSYAGNLIASVLYTDRNNKRLGSSELRTGSRIVVDLDETGATNKLTHIATAGGVTTAAEYDGAGQLLRRTARAKEVGADGEVTVRESVAYRPGEADESSNESVRVFRSLPWGVELMEERVGAGEAVQRSAWSYHTNVADQANYARLKCEQRADGSWSRWEYDADGRVTNEASALGNHGPDETEAACRAAGRWYAGDARLAALGFPAEPALANDRRARVEIETEAGVEVRRRYSAYLPDRTIRRRCAQSDERFDDPGGLLETTCFYTNGAFAGRPRWASHEDGTFSVYEYGYDAEAGTFTNAVRHGAGGESAVTNGTETTTVSDAAGSTLWSRSRDIASGLTIAWTEYALDGLGRVVASSNRLDGSYSTTAYGCCGPETEEDAEGIRTARAYNALKEVASTRRLGVTEQFRYDSRGNVVQRWICPDGLPVAVESSQYDSAGRLVAATNALGAVTRYSYGTNEAGGRVVTTVNADGGTRVESYYRDGRLWTVSGSAAAPACYEYGAAAGGAFAVEYRGADTNASEWVRTEYDLLGSVARVAYADRHEERMQYDARGRETLRTDGFVTQLTQYDERGEAWRQAVDMDGDGLIGIGGADRVTESESGYEMVDGVAMAVTTRRAYPANGSFGTRTLDTRRSSLDGSESWSAANGRTNRTRVARDRTAAARTVTGTAPDGTSVVQWYTNGLPMAAARIDADGAVVDVERREYDTAGRVIALHRTAPGGGSRVERYGYDVAGQVTNVVVAADGREERTRFEYDVMGRRVRTVLPDGGVVEQRYGLRGELLAQSGARTYPVGYGYDEQGRLTSLATYRQGTNGAADTTRWEYDARRGWLARKQYADGSVVSYTNYPNGMLKSRMWARGVETRYTYDASGALTNRSYSDGTPGVSFAVDREGRVIEVRDGVGVWTNRYDARGELTEIVWPGDARVQYGRDELGRMTNMSLRHPAYGVWHPVSYAYDPAGRMSAVTAAGRTAEYRYGADGITVTNISMGGIVDTVKRFDGFGRLTEIGSTPAGGAMIGFRYSYNAAGLRVTNALGDGSRWVYEYDELGQVTAGRKEAANGAAVSGAQFEYRYDTIGNREQSTDGSGRSTMYTANALNQYTEITSEGGAEAPPMFSGTVFLMDAPARVQADGPSAATLTYDADGNLLSDGKWTYTWDAENRLVGASNATTRLAFEYDYMGRRVGKESWSVVSGQWSWGGSDRFVYDNWNLISEVSHTPTLTNAHTFCWGLDLSGSLHGAGGIGGLLSILNSDSRLLAPVFDGNGNVMALVNTNGSVVAEYEYGPFGETIKATGPEAAGNAWRFSTRYTDTETASVMYPARPYSPTLGRFAARDPIAEEGGINVYGFVRNAPPNAVDALGLALYAFDGTANIPDDETNVYLTYDSGWGSPNAHYEKGIGNEEEYSALTTVMRQATGWGLSAKRSSMLSAMETFLESGDTTVDVIGFSRGAVTAIRFAEAVQKLKKKGVSPYCMVDRIRFLGLYDPVPGPFIRHRPGIPSIVQRTAVAYSLDEKRYEFTQSSYGAGAGVTAMGFRGGHSDVGGGYQERGLANISLEWMIGQGRDSGAPFKYPTSSKSPKMVRHQEVNYNLYFYADRAGLGGVAMHPSVSRLVAGPVDEILHSPRLGVDVTPYTYYLDAVGSGKDEYRVGDRRF